jgi:hypothetical protein
MIGCFGRKRHARVDSDGRALVVGVDEAGIQDRDGAQARRAPAAGRPSRAAFGGHLRMSA